MSEILYTIAKDLDGNLFTAQNAEKGNAYYCVSCDKLLILKKSGKIGPRTKRPHFAHKSTTDCQPETALHFGFKTLAVEKLNHYLQSGNRFDFSWHCEFCGKQHTGNYIKKLKSVQLEYDLKYCRPDIALLDHNNEIFAAIEIVVTHKPTERVLSYYLQNEIILIQINLQSDNDIYLIEEKLTKPDLVEFCINPRCKFCNNFKQKFIMTIIDAKCWKCFRPMKVAAMKDGCNKFLYGPEKFNSKEIAFAKAKGVVFKSGESHFNSCHQCGFFVKKFNMLHNYFSAAGSGIFPIQDFPIKYNCSYCTKEKISNDNE